MSLGIVLDKNRVDNTLGNLALGLRQQLTGIQHFKEWADTQTDTVLQNLFGYTSGEVAILRSALTDLDKLRAIFEGTATQATVYDFRTFAKQVWGLGI